MHIGRQTDTQTDTQTDRHIHIPNGLVGIERTKTHTLMKGEIINTDGLTSVCLLARCAVSPQKHTQRDTHIQTYTVTQTYTQTY